MVADHQDTYAVNGRGIKKVVREPLQISPAEAFVQQGKPLWIFCYLLNFGDEFVKEFIS